MKSNSMIAWELGDPEGSDYGHESDIGIGTGGALDISAGADRENLLAMNDFVQRTAVEMSNKHDLGKVPEKNWNKWLQQKAGWLDFYTTTLNSWYISEADMSNAAYLRNEIEKNIDPQSFQFVQQTGISTISAKKSDDITALGFQKPPVISTQNKIIIGVAAFLMLFLLGRTWIISKAMNVASATGV